jgi:hypothetical protein
MDMELEFGELNSDKDEVDWSGFDDMPLSPPKLCRQNAYKISDSSKAQSRKRRIYEKKSVNGPVKVKKRRRGRKHHKSAIPARVLKIIQEVDKALPVKCSDSVKCCAVEVGKKLKLEEKKKKCLKLSEANVNVEEKIPFLEKPLKEFKKCLNRTMKKMLDANQIHPLKQKFVKNRG